MKLKTGSAVYPRPDSAELIFATGFEDVAVEAKVGDVSGGCYARDASADDCEARSIWRFLRSALPSC